MLDRPYRVVDERLSFGCGDLRAEIEIEVERFVHVAEPDLDAVDAEEVGDRVAGRRREGKNGDESDETRSGEDQSRDEATPGRLPNDGGGRRDEPGSHRGREGRRCRHVDRGRGHPESGLETREFLCAHLVPSSARPDISATNDSGSLAFRRSRARESRDLTVPRGQSRTWAISTSDRSRKYLRTITVRSLSFSWSTTARRSACCSP